MPPLPARSTTAWLLPLQQALTPIFLPLPGRLTVVDAVVVDAAVGADADAVVAVDAAAVTATAPPGAGTPALRKCFPHAGP